MDFDFKIVTWERVKVPTEKEEEVLQALKTGRVTCSNDIWEICEGAELGSVDWDVEQMSVKENGDQSTIEVYEDGEIIFTNN